MARIDTLGNFLTDVADAIREKKGTSETIQASDFDTEIANLPSGGGLDWSAIGYGYTPQTVLDTYQRVTDDYNYSKNIYDNWVPQQNLSNYFNGDINLKYMPLVDTEITTNMTGSFRGCSSLTNIPLLNTSNVTSMYRTFMGTKIIVIPQFDTSKVTNMSQMFMSMEKLTTIPLLDTSKVTQMTNMFSNDGNLTDTSLDNILQMCIGATPYTGTKTLKQMGIASTYVTRIQALPHYQDFLDAGWTIGY